MGEPCFSILRKPKGFELANEMTLKRHIEGDDLKKCRNSIEDLLQSLLDGEKFPTNLMMPVINRYQMNKFTGPDGQDKRIKKLLYILWECLPKRGPDGKFLDRMVMVCGAFDKDLKHPNPYVCGCALRTLSKTREPEVIRELVHSIEKCLEWSHGYQKKNAVLAIAKIYKNFPELNPSAPKLIAEYLSKETDDECRKAALQALLEIAPEEAKLYLDSTNLSDIHCTNASIQLLFVELIQKIYKRGDTESKTYIQILSRLIRRSSSPSVRYQAAEALIKFSRNPEHLEIAAACFIDICTKDSDNNVKLIALDSLMNLRRITGSERILKNSIMDILFILQSATDLELNEKILRLSLDLICPLNVNGVVVALRHELKKVQDNNMLSSQNETARYRRLLIDTVHRIADKFPHAIIEHEMLDSLFDLLTCNSAGDKTAPRLISLLRSFMSDNPKYQESIIRKIQKCFNSVDESLPIRKGLVQLMGDYSETKEQIEDSYAVMKGYKFDSASVLSLIKMACRYQQVAGSESERHKMIAKFMFVLASILKVGHSNVLDSEGNPMRITNDQSENLQLGLNILQQLLEDPKSDVSNLIMKIVTENMRSQLGLLVSSLDGSNSLTSDFRKKPSTEPRFDDRITMSLFASKDDDLIYDADQEDSDLQSTLPMPDMFSEIPLTGTIDPIYAYCEFDVNRYDIGLKIHLENRTKNKTFENVTLELTARGDGNNSNYIDRPEPIVLAPRAKACVTTNVKVISAEVRRMFGSIAFDDVASDDREQVIMLNDININITDYIQPASINFDDFRDIWRECEWENKVTVKTKMTSLKDYLMHLVSATNMRCVTSDRGLSGECCFLSANLYAKSSFGEEALVNVSIEKENPTSKVSGTVKIRSRSQGMALSLGEKIQACH